MNKSIDMVSMVLDGIERDITESRTLLRKKNEKQVSLEETIQYLSRDNIILMDLFNEQEARSVQAAMDSATVMANTKLQYEEKIAACEGEIERVMYQCNQSIEENNLKSSKLSAASFLCEELQIKFKEKSDYCSKIESSLDELKEENERISNKMKELQSYCSMLENSHEEMSIHQRGKFATAKQTLRSENDRYFDEISKLKIRVHDLELENALLKSAQFGRDTVQSQQREKNLTNTTSSASFSSDNSLSSSLYSPSKLLYNSRNNTSSAVRGGPLGVNAYLNSFPSSRMNELNTTHQNKNPSMTSLSLVDDSVQNSSSLHDDEVECDGGNDDDNASNNERDDYFSNIHFVNKMDNDGHIADGGMDEWNSHLTGVNSSVAAYSFSAPFNDSDDCMQPVEMGDLNTNSIPYIQNQRPNYTEDNLQFILSTDDDRNESQNNAKIGRQETLSSLLEFTSNNDDLRSSVGNDDNDDDNTTTTLISNEYERNSTILSRRGRNEEDIQSKHKYEHDMINRGDGFSVELFSSEEPDSKDVRLKTNDFLSTTKLESMSLQELSRL